MSALFRKKTILFVIHPSNVFLSGLGPLRPLSGPFNLKNRLNPNTAVKWVNALSSEERQYVLVALQKKQEEEIIKKSKKKGGIIGETVVANVPGNEHQNARIDIFLIRKFSWRWTTTHFPMGRTKQRTEIQSFHHDVQWVDACIQDVTLLCFSPDTSAIYLWPLQSGNPARTTFCGLRVLGQLHHDCCRRIDWDVPRS